MKTSLSLLLAGALLVAVPAGLTLAQSSPDAKGPPAAEGRGPGGAGGEGRGWRREAPSPEMIQRRLDGRLAGAKAALRLTPQQEALWAPVEKVVRENATERMAFREQMRAERQQQSGRPDVMVMLDRMSERMSARATDVKQLADALRPLYATLSDDQKQVLRYELRHAMMGGMGGGRHGGPGHRG
jgi:hypothetical protein